MKKGEAELRLYACQAAGIIGLPELIEPLIDALLDDSEWVRTYAAIALGKIGDRRAIIPLIRSFSDRNADVHRNIVLAFERLGSEVYDELVKCLEGEDVALRRNAAIAVAETGDERGLDYLVMLMEDSEETVRTAAAEALGHFPGLKSRTILKEGLSDSALKVRLAILKSLGNFETVEDIHILFEHCAKAKDDREARTAKRILSVMAENHPNLFIDLFSHEQNSVKSMAYDALVGAGMESLPRLTQVAAESKSETIVFWCKKAIKKIKEPRESIFHG
jgi:HEAT repeat protein